MSKSQGSSSRRSSNISPSEGDPNATTTGFTSSMSNWESLFETHIDLVEAHVTMLDSLMKDLNGDKKAEKKVLGGMQGRAQNMLQDAKKAMDVLPGDGRRAHAQNESEVAKEVEGTRHGDEARYQSGHTENPIEGEKRKAGSVELEEGLNVKKRRESAVHATATPTSSTPDTSRQKSKRKASSEHPSDTLKRTKKERLTSTPPLLSTNTCTSSRKIKIPKSPRKSVPQPPPETTAAPSVDFTSLHKQLQAEIQAGLKLQAERLIEEEKLRERNGEKKKRKRERDSFGYEKGDVVGKKVRGEGTRGHDDMTTGRKRKADGVIHSGNGIVVPVGEAGGQRKRRSHE